MRSQNGFDLRWCALVVLALLVVAGPVIAGAQDAEQHEGHEHGEMHGEMGEMGQMGEMGEMSPEQQAQMQAWMKAMTPGEQHAHLADMAGDWDLTVKMWEEPGGEPTVSEAQATSELIMGGRYLRERVKGDMMGMPFVGEGLTGYDNVTGEYWSTWVDNMSTGLMTARGNFDDDAGGLVMKGQYPDPMTGKMQSSKTVSRKVSDDEWVMEMWGEGPGGEMMKMMEITYQRQ